MASIIKIGSDYRAQVYVRGKRVSKTFRLKAQAQQWAMDKERELSGHTVAGKTLKDAIERFEAEALPARKARFDGIALAKLKKQPIALSTLATLTPAEIKQWLDEMMARGLKGSTVNRHFNVLCAVLKYAKEWKWIESAPHREVKRPKSPPHRDRRISEDEIRKILIALEYDEHEPIVTSRQQIAVAFLLALETAMRQGEIWGLEWDRVHLKERYVTLLHTKNGTKRDVPLSARAIALIGKMPRTDKRVFTACSQTVLEVTFRRAVRLAEVKNLTFHDTRHEAITRLAKKVSVLDLARIVGHRDIRSLQVYYNPTAQDIAKLLG
jgi:integrase